jgi:DnaJ-class molecular chaperone
MFKDYYKILGISISANNAEIKYAYRQMSIKWHPDRNPGIDVTATMQDINEAYAILKDSVKRSRYDEEYCRFRGAFEQKETAQDKEKADEKESTQSNWTYEYDVQDENLKEDIKSAREYAKELVEEFLKELKESSEAAAKGAATNAFNYAVAWVAAGIIITIIGSLIRACN